VQPLLTLIHRLSQLGFTPVAAVLTALDLESALGRADRGSTLRSIGPRRAIMAAAALCGPAWRHAIAAPTAKSQLAVTVQPERRRMSVVLNSCDRTGLAVAIRHVASRLQLGRFRRSKHFPLTSSANISEGFFQLWILRGRSLISEATIAKYFGSAVIGTPFGKYSRRIRLALSLLPRCHGECGRAKYTGSPAAVILA
jgi:hypothetical protein